MFAPAFNTHAGWLTGGADGPVMLLNEQLKDLEKYIVLVAQQKLGV